jgi:hypothetical protein
MVADSDVASGDGERLLSGVEALRAPTPPSHGDDQVYSIFYGHVLQKHITP